MLGPMLAAGCVPVGPVNPSFNVPAPEAWTLWKRLESEPVELERPVVVVGSYRGPDPFVSSMVFNLMRLTSGNPDDFLRIPSWFDARTEDVVRRTIEMTADRFGADETSAETVEVDVVGLSMGGVVARAAALPQPGGGPRLKIRRLYTIASPHRGADMADVLAPDAAARDLRHGSAFIEGLNAQGPLGYELVAYGVLRDGIVGVENTAPPGEVPIWTQGLLFGSHLTANENKPILLDIALRLRGEAPLSKPGEPLPAEK